MKIDTYLTGEPVYEGDRVYCHDYLETGNIVRCYGTIHLNSDYPNVSKWYVEYDDNETCAVLDLKLIFKA